MLLSLANSVVHTSHLNGCTAVYAHVYRKRASQVEFGVRLLTPERALSVEQSPETNDAMTLTEFSGALFVLEWPFASMFSYVLFATVIIVEDDTEHRTLNDFPVRRWNVVLENLR